MFSGADAVVRILKLANVRTVFGIPSIHNIRLYEALRNEPDIAHILCRHESTGTHMADGYSRSGNRLGVMIASTGPGTGYVVPALQEAWGSSSPVLVITTNISSKDIGKRLGTLHELDNQDVLFSNITKKLVTIRSESEIPIRTEEAVHTALKGRPGPVYLEIPYDLLNREVPPIDKVQQSEVEINDLSSGLQDAVSMLQSAKQPLIIIGKTAGFPGIAENINILAKKLYAPVITTTNGKGVISDEEILSFGNATLRGVTREMVEKCDVALAIGTRLRDVDAKRRGLKLPKKLIHIDWDDQWVDRNYPAEIRLLGDVAATVRELTSRLENEIPGAERISCVKKMRERLDLWLNEIQKERKELQYLYAIREALPKQSSLVIDNTQLGYWAEYFYPSYCPNGLIGAKGSTTIGFALAGAMGVKLACPEKPVLALIGDGGFLYSSQELATCIRHKIGFPVIVVNDNEYGVISFLQRRGFEKEYETGLANPDFVALAHAYGIKAARVNSPPDLKNAIEEALYSGLMWLIELDQDFPEPPFYLY